MEQGFEGYYEIAGQDEITVVRPTELAAVGEINRQLDTVRPKAGVRWGFSPSWSPEELAAMPSAQAHVSRLVSLRDALMQKLSLANV